MQSCFDKVKKNFGFGCMRLPMKGDEVDFEETGKMVDMFLAAASTILTPPTATSTARARSR